MSRKPRQEEDTGTWMNTYSDLVTLLLTFFVLLFSMSSVDAEKWEAFVKAFANPGEATSQVVLNAEGSDPAGGPLPDMSGGEQMGNSQTEGFDASQMPEDFGDLYFYLQQYVQENQLESSVQVMRSGDSVVYIRFENNIFFDPDQYFLKQQAYEILDYVGDCLHSVEDQIELISINGHTAEVPYDYAISDWMLSSERASSVAIYFDDEKDIDPKKIRPIGYGKNFPIDTNDTPEGRERNRRVDITILKADSGLSDEELAGLFDPTQFPRTGGVEDILIPDNTVGSGTSGPAAAADEDPSQPGLDGTAAQAAGGASGQPGAAGAQMSQPQAAEPPGTADGAEPAPTEEQ